MSGISWLLKIWRIITPPALKLAVAGNFKEFYPKVIFSDFSFCEWLDLNLDASVPFERNFSIALLRHVSPIGIKTD